VVSAAKGCVLIGVYDAEKFSLLKLKWALDGLLEASDMSQTSIDLPERDIRL
jgi:hypothetical protein